MASEPPTSSSTPEQASLDGIESEQRAAVQQAYEAGREMKLAREHRLFTLERFVERLARMKIENPAELVKRVKQEAAETLAAARQEEARVLGRDDGPVV